MKEYLAYCRYGQWGCDYIVIQCHSDSLTTHKKIEVLAYEMSEGDDEALDAQLMLDELEEKGIITIIKLYKK